VFEYKGEDGKLRTVARASIRGVGHAERLVRNELSQAGIDPSKVTRIYSELQPCSNPPNISCLKMIQNEFPNASVSWSFDYQNGLTREESVKSLETLKDSVSSLFGG
jgi:acetate kinase